MNRLSAKLANFIVNVNFEYFPEKVIIQAKERVLDILAAAIAGACTWDYTDKFVETYTDVFENGRGTLIGRKEKTQFPNAAMVNACFAHSVELDDGHNNAGIHAGALVIPTSLSLAEKMHCSGQDTIVAIVLGYEIAYRFARNMSPILIQKGFHPTATCGALGATAASAKLLKLNEEETANALSLAAIQVGGLMESTISGQASKGIMVGHGAWTGIMSAIFAQNGFPAPTEAFEGKSGLLMAMSSDVNPNAIVKDLGKYFEICDTYVKLYPTCRHTHAPIEGIAEIREEASFQPEDVADIKVGTFPIAYDLTGSIHQPKDSQSARFSMAYCIATSLYTGTFGMKDLEDEKLKLKERHMIDNLVTVFVDNEITAEFPQKRGARVTVKLKDGRVFEKVVFKLKGSPDIPIGWNELKMKFVNAASLCFSDNKIHDILFRIQYLDHCNDVADITRLFSLDENKHENVS